MISRREFLKLAGISTFTFFAGRKLASLVNQNSNELTLISFLPNDHNLISLVVDKFVKKINSNLNVNELISQINADFMKDNIIKYGNFLFIKERLDADFNSDILISDNVYSIYDPMYSPDLFNLRSELRNRKAQIKLSCYYNNPNLLNQIFMPTEKKLQVVNQHGIFDEIPLSRDYSRIMLKGNQGKLEFSIKDGVVRVINSSCRNKHCVNSGLISQQNQNLACAPNKILLRIV